jgi:hypothetical protein
MIRGFLADLAILLGGALGILTVGLVDQRLTEQALGAGHSIFDSEPLMLLLMLASVALPPLLVAGVLLPRGRTTEVGLFLLGWGCLWPLVLAYLVFGAVAARLFGGAAPSISMVSGTVPMLLGLFFAVLPLAGVWFLTAGLRQRRGEGNQDVGQT